MKGRGRPRMCECEGAPRCDNTGALLPTNQTGTHKRRCGRQLRFRIGYQNASSVVSLGDESKGSITTFTRTFQQKGL
jgi:hypothetical protein